MTSPAKIVTAPQASPPVILLTRPAGRRCYPGCRRHKSLHKPRRFLASVVPRGLRLQSNCGAKHWQASRQWHRVIGLWHRRPACGPAGFGGGVTRMFRVLRRSLFRADRRLNPIAVKTSVAATTPPAPQARHGPPTRCNGEETPLQWVAHARRSRPDGRRARGCSSMVEHQPSKLDVARSSRVARCLTAPASDSLPLSYPILAARCPAPPVSTTLSAATSPW